MSSALYRLGIDIGGTFTDLVLLREGAPPVVATASPAASWPG